jgi:hypothetical protein
LNEGESYSVVEIDSKATAWESDAEIVIENEKIIVPGRNGLLVALGRNSMKVYSLE